MRNDPDRTARLCRAGLRKIIGIVRSHGATISVDLDSLCHDLCETAIRNNVRYFSVQAHRDVVEAAWTLTLDRKKYVILVSNGVASREVLRKCTWTTVLYHVGNARSHDRDLQLSWTRAASRPFRDRRLGVVDRLPKGGGRGVVLDVDPTRPPLELLPRDAKNHDHVERPTTGPAEPVWLAPGALVAYTPARRLEPANPLAWLTSRLPDHRDGAALSTRDVATCLPTGYTPLT